MSLPDEARNERGEDDLNRLLRDIRRQARRFWAYLSSRSSESWLFFGAGLLVGMFIG